MKKVKPSEDYPPEKGRYIRGNDFSPVAVAIILTFDDDKIPPDIEELVRAGAETGAALSGTVQTPNIGFEKMICNIVANTNIRYLILGGPESEGHLTGEALKALCKNGVDDKKRIIGTQASHGLLYNIPMEFINRFRAQITLIDLQFQSGADIIRKTVWSCYQENPVPFNQYQLSDPGAFSQPPLSGKITWQSEKPWYEPKDEKEQAAKNKMLDLIERLKKK